MSRTIIGAYVYWTRPRLSEGSPWTPLDRAVLAASALVWKAANGPAWLFTDALGREELRDAGLLPLFDRVDDTSLDEIPEDVNAKVFWDLGKAFVLDRLPLNACVLDLDLIVWESLAPDPDGVGFLHWEAPVLPWYPDASGLVTPEGYVFDPDLAWGGGVCNTAFIRCPTDVARRTFVDGAMRFARGNLSPDAGIAEMLFSGQRWLAHTIRKEGVRPQPMVEYLYVPCGQSLWLSSDPPIEDPLLPNACERGIPFTHLWQHKHMLRRRPKEAAAFQELLVRRCRARLGPAVATCLPLLEPTEEP